MTALDRAVGGFAVALIAGLLGVVMAGVITRGLGDPLIWTDEAARFLMIWLALAGWFLASRRRAHIRVRFFIDLLPNRPRRLLESLIQCALVVFGVLLVWHGSDLIGRNLDVSATTLPVPMAVMYLPVVLAGLVTAAQALLQLVRGG